MIKRICVGPLQTNCWIISDAGTLDQGQCILVDPGGDGDLIISELKNLRLYPRFITLTHAHFDHVAALPRLSASFPDADIVIHEMEAAKLGPSSLELHRMDFKSADAYAYVDAIWEPLPPASQLLRDGDMLGSFSVLHLPGHSPGSIGLYSAEKEAFISGDTLFRRGLGRTDLPGGDSKLFAQSLQRVFALDKDTQVFPGHGPATSIGAEYH